ncbi:MAG TPA: PrsW family glutamic-type intramembrane protease [Methanoregulaceae archaeon]|nr:MAG: PrsW family intramembrane metalloprotease [Methanolinea sp.]HON82226.1 PrsW family glutamic-type intramembrane protease [Methanoregulaceae archaeon]HPD09972.1 PrsW family glutamic-type intramembrane protease [Methanoregulaceae archaeon]HRT14975.1 PrsW family glutamic-type intramembrane protease [Methanoregulaceae archaeon]HRU30548.1 PrsW family glutamic-type intramembrane protease [Methanoregulaceae archaeon]
MLGLFVLAIAPAVFILSYFYLKDRYEPEPLGWVAKVFFIGAFMTIPAVLLEMPFSPGLMATVVAAPIIEELLKFCAVYFTVYRDEEFDEPVDGIVYASAAALGFAMVENVAYVLEGGMAVGVIRAVASVPAHALFSSIWGYSLGVARFRPANQRTVLVASGLAGAMLFHGFFNLLASDSMMLGLVVILVLLVPSGWWLAHRNIGHAHNHPASARMRMGMGEAVRPAGDGSGEGHTLSTVETEARASPSQGRFCTRCGSPVSPADGFCRSCGAPVDRE